MNGEERRVYKFPVYWTDKLKVDFLQRVILIHSYLYYEADNSVWSDKKYDEVAKQLKKEAKGVPFLTIFTFGEYGTEDHGENTCGGLMLSFTGFAQNK